MNYVPAINALSSRRLRIDEMYGFDEAWHLEREFTGYDARLAKVMSSTPSVLDPGITLNKEIHKSLVCMMALEYQCLCYISTALRDHRPRRVRGKATHPFGVPLPVGQGLRGGPAEEGYCFGRSVFVAARVGTSWSVGAQGVYGDSGGTEEEMGAVQCEANSPSAVVGRRSVQTPTRATPPDPIAPPTSDLVDDDAPMQNHDLGMEDFVMGIESATRATCLRTSARVPDTSSPGIEFDIGAPFAHEPGNPCPKPSIVPRSALARSEDDAAQASAHTIPAPTPPPPPRQRRATLPPPRRPPLGRPFRSCQRTRRR